jgi:hypothetical protein
MSIFTWKELGFPTLIPLIIELIAFNGRLSNPIWIVPNILIELGNKTIVINVIVMIDLVDYNIHLGHDYINSMNAMMSMLF